MKNCLNTKWTRRLLVLLCLVIPGCSSEGRTLSLDKEAARDACQDFLTAWKTGEKTSELAPDIIGRDEDWDAGQKLVNFELLPNEMDGGSNLHIPVRLTLKKVQGGESQLNVTYIVGTSPQVTVFRE